jgi:hypothetical protein
MGILMRRLSKLVCLALSCLSVMPFAAPALAQGGPPLALWQNWTPEDRKAFYTTSQGSRMMPYQWLKALERIDEATLFLADGLARYGYLPNPDHPQQLPVGFVIDGTPATGAIGMTCAACHTGQIEVGGKSIRIDGGPTNADFQKFLRELTIALDRTASDAQRFAAFAKRMPSPPSRAAFREFTDRFKRFMDKSLPKDEWGPARLDAFGMIFNRVAGLDLGVPGNVQAADAPVSYPFLWNAHQQDKIQWNGLAPNGTYLTALGRNVGEVLGVFAELDINVRDLLLLKLVDFDTSAKIAGLQKLEELVDKLRPPAWQEAPLVPFNPEVAARGKLLYDQHCVKCHQVLAGRSGPTQPIPIQDVETDRRMADNARRSVDTGKMEGTVILPPFKPLAKTEPAAELLAAVVGGTIAQQLRNPWSENWRGLARAIAIDLGQPETVIAAQMPKLKSQLLAKLALIRQLIDGTPSAVRVRLVEELSKLYRMPAGAAVAAAPAAYEARPLHGIWATAPYLHNGSVPTLWQLLLPPDRRIKQFKVGTRRFNQQDVGIDIDAPDANILFDTTRPGNGNGGHDYGTRLEDPQRRELLEYLKTL